jgi:hypothetical protein
VTRESCRLAISERTKGLACVQPRHGLKGTIRKTMAIRNVIVFGPIVQLLLLSVVPASLASADAGEARIQLCWALGKFDNTVYFAEAEVREDREDRQASFAALIEISGIDHESVECRAWDAKAHRQARLELMKRWSELELEIVNTTFLSELDY